VVVAVEHASPAVVNISTERVVSVSSPLDDYFDRLFGRWHRDWSRQQQRTTSTLGSGAIIDPAGYIITNEHVTRMASRILVQLRDQEEPVEATLIAADPAEDLALIRIYASDPLPWLPLGTSADLMIGETAIAIGNPFGLKSTVSTGVVSALGRSVQIEGNVMFSDFLQIDAAINPGNSGGPLLNINGEVIGITTAIRSEAEGIGFAIPVDRVRQVIGRLSDPGRLRGTHLGLGTREQGHGHGTRVLVAEVEADGPAQAAGIQVGDLIVAVDGSPVTTTLQVHKFLLPKEVGDEVRLTLRRGTSPEQTVTLELARVPLSANQTYLQERLGLWGHTTTPEQLQAGVPPGYVVDELRAGGPAAELGLRVGDVVIGFAVGRRDLMVRSERALLEVVKRLEPGVAIDIIIARRGRTMRGTIVAR
jgi:serine protease Do